MEVRLLFSIDEKLYLSFSDRAFEKTLELIDDFVSQGIEVNKTEPTVFDESIFDRLSIEMANDEIQESSLTLIEEKVTPIIDIFNELYDLGEEKLIELNSLEFVDDLLLFFNSLYVKYMNNESGNGDFIVGIPQSSKFDDSYHFPEVGRMLATVLVVLIEVLSFFSD